MKLFKGLFNWYGQIFELYSHAQRASRAHSNMIKQLSDTLGINITAVRLYLMSGNRSKIEEVKT
jgi:hypothetical protein